MDTVLTQHSMCMRISIAWCIEYIIMPGGQVPVLFSQSVEEGREAREKEGRGQQGREERREERGKVAVTGTAQHDAAQHSTAGHSIAQHITTLSQQQQQVRCEGIQVSGNKSRWSIVMHKS